MRKLLFPFKIISGLLLFSCSSPATEEKTPTTIGTQNNGSQVKESQPKPTTDVGPGSPERPLYAQADFHWGKYKQQNKQMLNCGGKKPKGLWKDSVPGFFYSYCDFDLEYINKKKNPGDPPQKFNIEFEVFTKGKKIPYYSDSILETPVFIKCNKPDKRLEGFDLVGKHEVEVFPRYGLPDTMLEGKHIYLKGNELMLVRYGKNLRINMFYWLKLEKRYGSVSNIPSELLLLE